MICQIKMIEPILSKMNYPKHSINVIQKNTSFCFFKKIIRVSLICIGLSFSFQEVSGQVVFSLQQTINLAVDSSIQALNARNEYLRGEWQYHSFKVYHLPTVTLQTNPIAYNRVFVRRYDSENNIDIYREQQSLYSYGNLSIQQNFGLTGGRFFVDTEVGFLRNFGSDNPYTQFSSVPFRVGYSQSLFGFNPYKWDKQIEPLKYVKVRKKILYDIALTTEKAAEVFFELAASQASQHLAAQQLANADTLYKIGLERYNLGLLPKSDLLALKLQALNTKSILETAILNRKRSYFNYCHFLRIEPQSEEFEVSLPTVIEDIDFDIETAVQSALKNNPSIPEVRERVLSAERELEQAKRANRFSANVSASLGFNQVANTFSGAYTRPLQQNMASVSLTIPILDWGVGKGKIAVADENLHIIKLESQQTEEKLMQEVINSVSELNLFRSHFITAVEAKEIADEAYTTARELFIVGKTDLSSLNLAVAGQIEAENGYVQALRNYWNSYYKVKRLTLI